MSTWSRSPRPTSFTPRWRSPPCRPASMCGAKSRWRRPSPRRNGWRRRRTNSGKVAVLGYNYIQSPAVRHIGRLLEEKIIGDVNHMRIEMDEDFMADAEALFFWRNESASGYGALDDFAVHPLSLIAVLFGRVRARHVPHGEALCRRAPRHRASVARSRRYDIGQRADRTGERRCGHAAGQPLRVGPQGPHRAADLRLEGVDPVRSGALERGPALCHLGPGRPSRVTAPSSPARRIRPIRSSFPRRDMGSASTI